MDAELAKRIGEAAKVLRRAGAREVYVFGSAAKGTLRRHSDLDIAVVGLPAKAFLKAMGEAADVLGRPVDLLDLDRPTPLTRFLMEEGELERVG